ncbi:hypothetical protein OXX80_001118 [Metschnikowia pulcherrima]
MTAPERPLSAHCGSSITNGPIADSKVEEQYKLRRLSFSESPMSLIPSDSSTNSGPSLSDCEISIIRTQDDQFETEKDGSEVNIDDPCPEENKQSHEPTVDKDKTMTSLMPPVAMKSKRSSSTSNDSYHERDRFRARFESFNPPTCAITEDLPGRTEPGLQEYEEISTKTKKLNLQPLSASTSMECTMSFASQNPEDISPLDRNSAYFNSYKPCPVSDATRVLDLRLVTPSQLSKALKWYFNTPLPPTGHMFPWLHGLHPENFVQRSFFIANTEKPAHLISHESSSDCMKPESARFVMCVETASSTPHDASKILRNTVAAEEILQRVEFARSEVRRFVSSLIPQLFLAEQFPHIDLMALAGAIIQDCLDTGFMPAFIDSDPKRGVSLRNFHIQVNKIAACADFVVYCHEETHGIGTCKCMAFARLLKVAQITENRDRPFKFDVFVFARNTEMQNDFQEIWTVRDSSSFLANSDARRKTQLNLSDLTRNIPNTFSSWDADYQVKEKLETTVMSAASKLNLNVWSGNIWDHQIMMQFLKEDPQIADIIKITPTKGVRGTYCDPQNSLLTRSFADLTDLDLVTLLPPPRSHWQLFVHCHNDASFPSQKLLNELLFKYTITSRKASEVQDIHHLDFPSSGSVGFGDCRQDNLMSIVNTCKLLYLYSSSVTDGSIASLIYCSDGYTESSLLIFCFLMYAEDIPLEKAMLKLHLQYGRPYYVFNSDVQVLRKLEILLRKYSPLRLSDEIIWSQAEEISQQEINLILLRPKSRGSEGKNSIPRRLRLGYIASDSSSESEDSDCDDFESENEMGMEKSWVEDLEGSLPSRILPHIYLGSLKHANNLTVLSKLGITKIISVGESLEWLTKSRFYDHNDVSVETSEDGNVEMIHINPKRMNYNSSGKRCDVTSVMKLNNLQDDGIDDLSRALPQILEHVQEEFENSSGTTKFLIHCRVGVSRSATVVIAEVMRRLKLNLPQAYLYVRVRRLNIVIQPNLRFMYELFKWDEKERRRTIEYRDAKNEAHTEDLRVIDWFVMCQEIKKLNQPFLRG